MLTIRVVLGTCTKVRFLFKASKVNAIKYGVRAQQCSAPSPASVNFSNNLVFLCFCRSELDASDLQVHRPRINDARLPGIPALNPPDPKELLAPPLQISFD